ncbi:transcription antitermination factor NusB [Thiomicrorhabdus sp. ZW0627]|uniref:transcription antitermination factor NusB n=1 Tax=Thiomicrorhabdus sp. ZW0627 TaxID=3039774 RepID=UPI0024365559|nr:transcription antitermination factor NusB [Thiomicrorhabdus sp. ZW0627]MDG6773209.1 transcription antitermination factor NusB [Thiomicrorhabdus sp. ZW0627]
MKDLNQVQPGKGEEVIEDEPKVSQRTETRRVALQALYQWQMNADEPFVIAKQFNEDGLLSGVDAELFNELLTEVSAKATDLDEVYGSLLDRSVSMIDPVEKTIMRMGVYELQAKPEIPYKVIINECVELAKRFGAEESHKYVNGVLDKVAQQLRSLEVNAS